ncbi:MAG: hypothetical protein H6709_09440 [Kofleriaceae bacterium]|nr:hypothetical protein [Kofleriaceae bacterium]MCB9572294.1 hypothetical protein [Kofleriaceae bacterium]
MSAAARRRPGASARSRLVALVVAAAAAAAPQAARADRVQVDDGVALLDQARGAVDDIDYERARDLVARALDGGGLTPAALARAYRMAGEIAGALDDADTARGHFLRWIMLVPDAALPAGSSPKIAGPFDAARAQAGKLPRFRVEPRARRGDGTITVDLDAHDPLQLVAGVRVVAGADAPVAADGTHVEVAAPAGPVRLTIDALDAAGNTLVTTTITVEGGAGAAGGGHRWPAVVRWPTWTGLAIAGGAAAGYFSWRVAQDQDDLDALNAASAQHSFDEARAIEDRGARHATYANVALAVAGTAAVAAILTLVLEPDGATGVEVAPLAGDGAVGAAAALRF